MSHASENFFLSNPQKNSVSENWFNFKSTSTKVIKNYVPHKNSTLKYKLPWITSSIKRHMRLKDRLHKKKLSSLANLNTGMSLRKNGTCLSSHQTISQNALT